MSASKNELSESDLAYLGKKYGFKPIEFIASAGEWDYSVHAYYVYRNKNRSYSIIYESHCSCYSIQEDGASLEGLYKNKEELIRRLENDTSGIPSDLLKEVLASFVSKKENK